ncbi:LysR substrate-binding domain-containing protein [Mesobacterium pallidum]|uniref:LysR substrate-binding domain-containing protein n=1 Tax=Mesobacterium pallidum TaxID=2872037 RepID=UPI001EE2BD5C|nr:LysR substrate-binding domain-containing protein [Mesobacterium pallidum]
MDWSAFPPLSALRAFSAYAATGSVAKAGAALNVSHAAISQQMRNLEDHMGLALLDRSGRMLRLTDEGAELALACEDGFGAISRAVESLTGRGADRPLQISATPSFAANWLMPRLAEFRALHPGVSLMIDPTAEVKPLTPGGIDLALRYGNGDWPGLDAQLIVRSPIVVVAAPGLVGDRQIDGPEDLRSFHWLQELGTNEATAWLAGHGVEHDRSQGMTALPGNLMLEAARMGQGVAITARVFAEADVAAGRLIELFHDIQRKGYFAVTRPGVQRPTLRAFLRWLRRHAEADDDVG